MTLAAAKRWFAPHMVLTLATEDVGQRMVSWYALSPDGTDEDPTESAVRLELLATPPGLDPKRDGEGAILAAGGYQLLQSINKESVIFAQRVGEPVQVRGQPGTMFKAGTLHSSAHVCNVSWAEPSADGRFRNHLFRMRLAECDDRRAVEIANRLRSA